MSDKQIWTVGMSITAALVASSRDGDTESENLPQVRKRVKSKARDTQMFASNLPPLANVRGRLRVRAGTTMQAWEGTLVEPFVIGSLWSNLSDNNSATLVSTGRSFRFNDDLEGVWGEISAGANFFNFSQTTAVFAKVDVTVGDDISGVGGKVGLRVNW